MNIGIIGETREPVSSHQGGGLGRHTHEIATDLMALGHDVTLYAPRGSEFAGTLLHLPHKFKEHEAFLDYSHTHEFSRDMKNALNLIGDRECQFMPNNAVVESQWMKSCYPRARIIPAGIVTDQIPFSEKHDYYLLFMGGHYAHKQPGVAQEVAYKAGKELRIIGAGVNDVSDDEKWRILGGALGLLCPYTLDASPRAPLEAAACGTPTLCFSADGTQDHVKDGISGFHCRGVDYMVDRVAELPALDKNRMRAWVEREHNNRLAISKIESMLFLVAGGDAW